LLVARAAVMLVLLGRGVGDENILFEIVFSRTRSPAAARSS